MARGRRELPPVDFSTGGTGRVSAYDEVVLGTETVAGGRGDVRGDGTGPRRKRGSTSNPRATPTDVDPTARRAPSYEEAMFGRRRHRGDAAPLTYVPTKTTNAQRPRTLAAGYDRATQTLTVVFRDGTTWNYYGVTYQMYTAFKASPSPGRYIRTRLDFKAYGPAAGQIQPDDDPEVATDPAFTPADMERFEANEAIRDSLPRFRT